MAVTTKLEIPKDFLADLPPSRKKVKARRLQIISKGKLESKHDRAKQMKERYAKELLAVQNKIDQNKHR